MNKSHFLLLILGLTTLSCGYNNDKLKIYNKSNSSICYETLIKDREGEYFQASAGDCIDLGKNSSPPLIGSIEYNMEQSSIDKVLYIVYYNRQDQEYVYKNIKTIVHNKKFKTDKYTLETLSRRNWKVIYDGK
jgi:hypothetical protein